MKPGEIYWVDLATGRRPSIVVSRESLNQGNYVVMVLCTTRRFAIRSKLPSCPPWHFHHNELRLSPIAYTGMVQT